MQRLNPIFYCMKKSLTTDDDEKSTLLRVSCILYNVGLCTQKARLRGFLATLDIHAKIEVVSHDPLGDELKLRSA